MAEASLPNQPHRKAFDGGKLTWGQGLALCPQVDETLRPGELTLTIILRE